MSQLNYAPFFRNGLLFLPRSTANLLDNAGFDTQVVSDAVKGLRLDDDSQKIAQLNHQLQQLIAQLDTQSAVKAQLTSSEVRFIFSSIEESEEVVQV